MFQVKQQCAHSLSLFTFFKITLNKIGGNIIELIEPTEGESIFHDFLKERGEGLYHIGPHKVSTLETFNQTSKDLEQAGYPCLMSCRTRGVAFSFFDTTKTLHNILEVVWVDPSEAIPTPVIRIFPEKMN